ncbi:hypothetical protein FA13DRAFT_1744741 [Coprinellus micaceus]|uniref:Uncharacterized protein n=1 Tax=Coprinellus micaceus TaxID=71717 RepID=A0A4Y7SC79_COPMI|nr:hypothetical protein FA13DRAFT_1744741 [Coprinellus micaceus]
MPTAAIPRAVCTTTTTTTTTAESISPVGIRKVRMGPSQSPQTHPPLSTPLASPPELVNSVGAPLVVSVFLEASRLSIQSQSHLSGGRWRTKQRDGNVEFNFEVRTREARHGSSFRGDELEWCQRWDKQRKDRSTRTMGFASGQALVFSEHL